MNSFKLIAIDLDDTLLNSQVILSAKNKEAILKAQAIGVEVTLATGRMYRSALPVARELQIDIPLITYQGALIKDPISGRIFRHRPVPIKYAREILDRGYQLGYHINIYLDDQLYVDRETAEAVEYSQNSKVPLNVVGDLRKYMSAEPTKILFSADPALLDSLGQELSVKYPQLHITKSKNYYLEIMDRLASKGQALNDLAISMGIAREQVIAIGDSYNDIDMIRFAGLGVAMGNAWAEVKKIADYVTDNHDNDGVAKVINRFILNIDT